MAVYPIISSGKTGNVKTPTRTWNNEEYVAPRNDFYLSDDHSRWNQSKDRCYRLHAKKAHLADDYLPYKVLCPQCHKEMKCIGGAEDLHKLGLYTCPHCNENY